MINSFENEIKEKWGNTKAYTEFTEKTKDYSKDRFAEVNAGLENIFHDFAALLQSGIQPDSADAQALVKSLQEYISAHYYDCTDDILKGLGQMYVADERFRHNIDKHAAGTTDFVCKAITLYIQ